MIEIKHNSTCSYLNYSEIRILHSLCTPYTPANYTFYLLCLSFIHMNKKKDKNKTSAYEYRKGKE